MTLEVTRWRDLPEWEGIYAMYDRKPPAGAAAYVGETNNVRARLVQHLVRRDSSVVTAPRGKKSHTVAPAQELPRRTQATSDADSTLASGIRFAHTSRRSANV